MEAVRVVGFVVAWVLVVGVLLGRNPGDPLRRRELRAGAALEPDGNVVIQAPGGACAGAGARHPRSAAS